MFDRSAPIAEHPGDFLSPANPCFSRRFRAIPALFGIFLPNAEPTSMQAALRGEQPNLREIAMQVQDARAVLLVDAKDAARMLAVSLRKLWAMTFEEQPGLPYVRCGRLVRYPVADLQRWIESQRKAGDAR